MKFGKWLKRQIEESPPQWRDKFISYKDLKKLVRLISANQPEAEEEFVSLLDAEIDKFNTFFIEQEEDFIIRQPVSACILSRIIVRCAVSRCSHFLARRMRMRIRAYVKLVVRYA